MEPPVAGTYLDPAGDKIFVACISASLAAKGFIPTWLAASFITRDLALVGGVSYKRARELRWRWLTWGQFFCVGDGNLVNKSLPPLEPKTIGKICTALQFALFTGAMLHHTHGWPVGGGVDSDAVRHSGGDSTVCNGVLF